MGNVRNSHWFRSLTLALVMIAIAAVWRLSMQHRRANPKDFTVRKVADLPAPDRARLNEQLATEGGA